MLQQYVKQWNIQKTMDTMDTMHCVHCVHHDCEPLWAGRFSDVLANRLPGWPFRRSARCRPAHRSVILTCRSSDEIDPEEVRDIRVSTAIWMLGLLCKTSGTIVERDHHLESRTVVQRLLSAMSNPSRDFESIPPSWSTNRIHPKTKPFKIL